MGMWDKIFGEFVDVIEWTDDSRDTMVYRFERYGNEIKYGAMLTVRESQIAILINEGRVADIFEPGLYQLETNNMPVLTTLENWPHGFSSPFKAEVYFFNMRRFTDLKWGTKNPIMLRDREFGPLRIRAFGSYAVRIKDPVVFSKEIVGTDGHFHTVEISDQLRNLILSRFASILGEADIPVLDLAANYDDLSEYISAKIQTEFYEYGLEVNHLLVENISLPPEVEKALDKRSAMGILGNLRDYASFQTAEAMLAAANNPAGSASEGIGMGMGFAMAREMGKSYSAGTEPQKKNTAAPPPIPEQADYYVAVDNKSTGPFNLADIKNRINSGAITKNTLLWNQALVDWTAAEKVPELVQIFTTTPPPLPK